jgi:hypothetical protein
VREGEHAVNRFGNTSLQRGVLATNRGNRFSDLLPTFETAEAVRNMYLHAYTPLKQGVNDSAEY